jgi:manganese/zinc/iron transport system substrate-binding protein
MSVSLWQNAVKRLTDTLVVILPDHSNQIQTNYTSYAKELNDLHAETLQAIADIPEKQRVLVTAHDAFGYFGKTYDIKVRGLQGISTSSEYGLKDLEDLTEYLMEQSIPAIFVESSIPDRSIQAVIRGCKEKGHNIKLGGTLYSDAMGAENTPEGTYVGMIRSNVTTIVNGLR